MLSFSQFGHMGRLGNQMFQYAFMRTRAQALGVGFCCPAWPGDDIFDLGDQGLRTLSDAPCASVYREPKGRPGYHAEALSVGDETDLRGYFQSSRYFARADAQRWFRFKPEMVDGARRLLSAHTGRAVAAVHLRLGDYLDDYLRQQYYVPRRRYYTQAVAPVIDTHQLIVISDQPERARDLLQGMWPLAVFSAGLSAAEDLYVLTQADYLVCSPSTFSWWGGWLGAEGRTVVVPAEGAFRPGASVCNPDFWPAEWQRIQALYWLWDHSFSIRARINLRRRLAQRRAALP